MIKEDYYKIYQSNLIMLEYQIKSVKKTTQTMIGRKIWFEDNNINTNVSEEEIKSGTQLFAFLICSWLEARLMKLIYEGSSVAFSECEISKIRNFRKMKDKWRECFLMSICKCYGFSYSEYTDYSSSFSSGSVQRQNYNDILSFFDDIEEAITIRNRLAHGQWNIQLNSDNTAIIEHQFFDKYDNIQKLDILLQCYREIADIINSYATYKDKLNPNFDNIMQKKIVSVKSKMTRISRSKFDKYVKPFKQIEEKKREMWKDYKHEQS